MSPLHVEFQPPHRDRSHWQRRVEETLNSLPVSGPSGRPSWIPPLTEKTHPHLAIMVKGFLSSLSSRELDSIASSFSAVNIPPIYFSYNGVENPDYATDDTARCKLSVKI